MEGTCIFQIRRMGPSAHNKVYSDSQRIGCCMTEVVRPLINKIISSYPAYMSEAPAPKNRKKLDVSGMSTDQRRKLENISTHIGVDVGALFKVEVARVNPQVKQ